MRRHSLAAVVVLSVLASACKKEVPPPLYEPMPVARRDITVSAEAAGTINPILIVDVKSRASGTILRMNAETGDMVHMGDTLVIVDKRDPTTTLEQATADLEVAQAQLDNATTGKARSDTLFAHQLMSEQDHETATLNAANARAGLVRAQAALQAARDAMTDTDVRAPISGTVIQRNVEAGNVIASAVRDVSGGTVLLRMADLSMVQVSALVDETDIGKIAANMPVTITVDAYPNRPFQGTVLKIEPQSTVNQNVTMFPVLINIPNPDGALRPGMNAEVEIHVANRANVIAIPNAALRTQRDVMSAAQVLGLDPMAVATQLAQADSQRARDMAAHPDAQPQTNQPAAPAASDSRSFAGRTPNGGGQADGRPGGRNAAPNAMTQAPNQNPGMQRPTGQGGFGGGQNGGPGGGFQMQLPAGVTQDQAMALRGKRMNGEPFTHADSLLSDKIRAFRDSMRAANGGGQGGFGRDNTGNGGNGGQVNGGQPNGGGNGGGQFTAGFPGGQGGGGFGGGDNPGRRRFGANNNFQFGGSYIVFVLKDGKPAPVRVRTGVTDMDYSEVVSGLTDKDTVLMLPSASLINSQQQMRDRFQRMTGGGALPGMKAQTPNAPGGQGGGPGGGGAPPAAAPAPAPAAPKKSS